MHDDGEPDLATVLAEVRRIDVASRRLVADVMAGGWSSVFRGAGLEVDEVREYQEGDDPRAVDPAVTARMGRPFVKRYVDEREQTVLFVLDLSASTRAGTGAWSTRQAAARVVACLGLAAAGHGDKVGLVAAAAGGLRHVAPRKGVPHVLRVVRDALALPAGGAGPALATALGTLAHRARRRAVVFVLSDFLEGGWRAPLSVAARRHDVVAVRLLPPEVGPAGLPDVGLLRVRDPETGTATLVDAGAPRARAAWDARTGAWRAATEAALRAARVDRLDVEVGREPGPEVVAGPIVRFFRMREARGAKR